ncbi:MAG TPA: helix-hairpin-helix domain-containing protein [Methylomirabilota bacterium]|nr:helix-hairpin-helix domain-containing protein [Methylomirabilota bacterium]
MNPLRRAVLPLCLAVAYLCFLFALQVAGTKKPPLRPVNINTASETELQKVPGIGPTTAKHIVAARKSVGGFRSVDDLLAVPGIGQKRLAKMRKYLTVGKPPAAADAKKDNPPPAKPPSS